MDLCTYGLVYVNVSINLRTRSVYICKEISKETPVFLPQLFHHSLYLGIQMYYVKALHHEYYLVHQYLHTKSVYYNQPVPCSSLCTVFITVIVFHLGTHINMKSIPRSNTREFIVLYEPSDFLFPLLSRFGQSYIPVV